MCRVSGKFCCMGAAGKKLFFMGCRRLLLCHIDALWPQAEKKVKVTCSFHGPILTRNQWTRLVQAGPLAEYHHIPIQNVTFLFNNNSTVE
jgi:hypothetical protein